MNHKFVEFIPSEIDEHLYVSIEYNVAKHKCACCCGEDIITHCLHQDGRLHMMVKQSRLTLPLEIGRTSVNLTIILKMLKLYGLVDLMNSKLIKL